MRITILTSVFYPEIHPRAFRAHELAKEFARSGHNVKVIVLTTVKGFDYSTFAISENISIELLNLYSTSQFKHNRQSFSSKKRIFIFFYSIYRYLVEFFLAGNLFIYGKIISQKINVDSDCDLLISLSTPFMDLYGVALYRLKAGKTNTVFVADSGDPFYYSQQTKRAFYFKWLERWVYKHFDFLSIPTESAIPAYDKLLDNKKIRIIPQGFDFETVTLAPRVDNPRVTFAYAGVFYTDIRNPEFLLSYLTTVKIDFLFRIFLRYDDPLVSILLDKYKLLLGDKIQIQYGLSREKLLYEISTCDFLVNIGNTTQNQLPSKLIDYGITQRPIYSCVEETFQKQIFEQFLLRNYESFNPLDISKYNIKVVVSQFIKLV